MEASVDRICSEDFVERVRLNQPRLSSEMKSYYDFIIRGSGSSPGSVVAGQRAENPQVSVLLIDAGSNVPSVNEPGQWFLNPGPNGTGTFGRGRLLRHGRTDPLEMLGAEKQKHVLRGGLRLPDDLVVRRLA
jgi:choline dehydrogenase-like flavoprotein